MRAQPLSACADAAESLSRARPPVWVGLVCGYAIRRRTVVAGGGRVLDLVGDAVLDEREVGQVHAEVRHARRVRAVDEVPAAPPGCARTPPRRARAVPPRSVVALPNLRVARGASERRVPSRRHAGVQRGCTKRTPAHPRSKAPQSRAEQSSAVESVRGEERRHTGTSCSCPPARRTSSGPRSRRASSSAAAAHSCSAHAAAGRGAARRGRRATAHLRPRLLESKDRRIL